MFYEISGLFLTGSKTDLTVAGKNQLPREKPTNDEDE
jgi:hypothetical protein